MMSMAECFMDFYLQLRFFALAKCAGSAMIRYPHDSNSIYLCGGLGR